MKHLPLKFLLGATLSGCLLLAPVRADDEDVDVDHDVKSEVRVLVAGDGNHVVKTHGDHVVVDYAHGGEDLTGAFLGVETARASAVLREQLGLPRGIGLVVQRVVPDTAAANALKKHDILTKLNDQLLVSSDQLGVLIRSNDPGATVTLTFLRGGKEMTADVELGERKPRRVHHRVIELKEKEMELHGMEEKLRGLEQRLHGLTDKISREEVERLMETLQAERVEKARGSNYTWTSKGDGPMHRMMSINLGNIVFSDDDGVVELLSDGAGKTLVVKDVDGNVLFDGPIGSAEEREALSAEIQQRLKKVEGIETIEVKTDVDFETDNVRFGPSSTAVEESAPELEAVASL